MSIRHSAAAPFERDLLAKASSVRLDTDRKTILLLRDRSAKTCGQARLKDVGAYSSSLHATCGSISSSRCQTTCRRPIEDRGPASPVPMDDICDGVSLRRPGWWSQTGSNRRPPACKAGALPTELWPHQQAHSPKARRLKRWWAWEDLNFRPHAYQARALTN
jgi:hypothetical protein